MVSVAFNLAFAVLGAGIMLVTVVSFTTTVHEINTGRKAVGECGFFFFVCIILIAVGVFFFYRGVTGSIEMYLLEGV